MVDEINVIHIDLNKNRIDNRLLGFVGEHLKTKIIINFDVSTENYNTVLAFALPCGETRIAELQKQREFFVPQGIMQTSGTVSLQVTIYVGAAIVKTETFYLDALPSVEMSETEVDKNVGLMDDTIKRLNEVADSAINPPQIIDGNWYVWESGGYKDTGVKAVGQDGADGKDGADYALTAADKTEIAHMAISDIADGDEVKY